MKDEPSAVNLKATVGAGVIYLTAMGVAGVYWALQCGSHWFTYSIISYLPFALPGAAVVYAVLRWLLPHYGSGNVRHWKLAAVLSVVFFVVCFVFAHLQPEMQLYNGNDCQPF